jgi:hypothetical protein
VGVIWENIDVNDMMREFGIQCLYFESRLAPDKRFGQTKLESDAIHGFRYNSSVEERLMRTSISQRIILSEYGRIYDGGARFTIPPVKLVDGLYIPVPMHERAFSGDVIAIKTKVIRDFDVLKKGYRDQLFAFDVKTILSVASIDADGNEHIHLYGRDYTLQVDGTTLTATKRTDEDIYDLITTQDMAIASQIDFVWNTSVQTGETTLDVPSNESNYTVEFLCSPNYVIYNYSDKARATEENDLPRTVMCVKRAYFNPVKPKMDEVDTKETIMDTPSQVFDEQY